MVLNIIRLKVFLNHTKTSFRNYTIRRALLYVPGNDEAKIKNSLKFKIDCIAFDCENVPYNVKEIARETIRKFLDQGPVTRENPEWCIKINPVYEQKLCEEDINTILSANNLPPCICLPKINHVDHLQWFAEKVWSALIKRPENERGPIQLLMCIESAAAIMGLQELCRKAEELSTMAPIIPAALIFEANDVLGSLGLKRTNSGIEFMYARQKLVLVAKAFGLQAIDQVTTNYEQLPLLKEECQQGATLGFTGKQVIHPNQITVTQEIFVPSRSKVQWAKSVLQAFSKYQDQESFSFENSIIDMPSIRQAKYILKVADKVKDIRNQKVLNTE